MTRHRWHGTILTICIHVSAGRQPNGHFMGRPARPAVRLLQLPAGGLQVQVPLARKPAARTAHRVAVQVRDLLSPMHVRRRTGQHYGAQQEIAKRQVSPADFVLIFWCCRDRGFEAKTDGSRSLRAAARPPAGGGHSRAGHLRHQQHGPKGDRHPFAPCGCSILSNMSDAALLPIILCTLSTRYLHLSTSLSTCYVHRLHDQHAEESCASTRAGDVMQAHIELGKALAPLQEEGVLILGSGSSFHSIPAMMSGTGQASKAAGGQRRSSSNGQVNMRVFFAEAPRHMPGQQGCRCASQESSSICKRTSAMCKRI